MGGVIELTKEKLIISEDVEDVFKKKVTPFGNGAKIGCPRDHLGKTVYVVVCTYEESST